MTEQRPNLDYGERTTVGEVQASGERENLKPREGDHLVPVSTLIVGCLILVVGGGYFGAHFQGLRVKPIKTTEGQEAVEPGPGSTEPAQVAQVTEKQAWIDEWMAGGKQVYTTCVACHQPTGGGLPNLFPPLAGSEWVSGSDERIAAIIMSGMMGPVTVKGAVFNGAMPGQGAMFNDKQIAQVMTYIRRSWGNNAAVVTEEMVAHARAKHGARVTPWTEPDIKAAIPEDAKLPGAEVDEQTGEPISGG